MKNHSFQWLLLCFLILFWGYLLCCLITPSNPAKLLCNLTPLQKEPTCSDLRASPLLLPCPQSVLFLPFLLQGSFFTACLTPHSSFPQLMILPSISQLNVHTAVWAPRECAIPHCPACPLMSAEEDTSSFPSLHMCLLITLFRGTVYWLSLCLQLNTAKHLVFTVPLFCTTHPVSSQLLQNRCLQISL